jgi:hypothetical protein
MHTKIILSMLCLSVVACAGSAGSSEDESEALGSGTHFNFAASMLVGPNGPAFYSQLRPVGSEVPDVMCPGPSYTPTARIYDSNKKVFSGTGGSCDGKYAKTSDGEIVIQCATAISSYVCP